jgi:hypothetical protein
MFANACLYSCRMMVVVMCRMMVVQNDGGGGVTLSTQCSCHTHVHTHVQMYTCTSSLTGPAAVRNIWTGLRAHACSMAVCLWPWLLMLHQNLLTIMSHVLGLHVICTKSGSRTCAACMYQHWRAGGSVQGVLHAMILHACLMSFYMPGVGGACQTHAGV